jgi:hypothetical protein
MVGLGYHPREAQTSKGTLSMAILVAPLARFLRNVRARSKTRLGRDGDFQIAPHQFSFNLTPKDDSGELENPMLCCTCALRCGDRIGASARRPPAAAFHASECRAAARV